MKRKLAVLAMFLILLMSLGASESLHYTFNDSSCPTPDVSGNGQDGSCSGDLPTVVSGQFDDAFSFDGTGDAVDAGSDPDYPENEDLTLAAWVKTSSSSNVNIIARQETSDFDGYELKMDDGATEVSGGIRICVQGDAGSNCAGTPSAYNNGNWVFAVGQFDKSTSNLSIWVNGELENWTKASPGNFSTIGENLGVGARVADSSQFIDGEIDEPRVFNEILTKDEIQRLNNSNTVSEFPSFDSIAVSPSPMLFNRNISTEINVSDDGSVVSLNISNVWQGGTITESDIELSQQASGNWTDTNFTNITVKDEWVNITYIAEDNDGLTTKENHTEFIDDKNPEILFSKPKNRSYYSYDVSYNITAEDDRDDVQDETVDCRLFDDGNEIRRDNSTEGKLNFSGTVSHDFGRYSFKASCSDPTSTLNQTSNYWINHSSVLNESSNSPVFETANTSYQFDIRLGDMVQDISANLSWDNDVVDQVSRPGSGVRMENISMYQEIPLVDSNDSVHNWSVSYDLNVSDFNAATFSTVSNSTKNNSQNVWHSFYLNESYLDPTDYIEGETYNHYINISNESGKGTFTATNTFYKTGNQKISNQNGFDSDNIWFLGNQNVGSINSSSTDYNVSGEVKVEFNGDSRFIEADNSTLTVFQPTFTDCSGGSLSQTVALNLTTIDEQNRSEYVSSDIDLAFNVWKVPSNKRTYNFSSTGEKFHTFCIYPSDENYTIQSTQQQVLYMAENYSSRSYYILKQGISNDTTRIPLYMLDESQATDVVFELEDSSGDAASQIVLAIERYFPSEDKFIRVAMGRTGSEGKTETTLKVGDEENYRFNAYNLSSSLVDSFPSQVITSSPVALTIGQEDRKIFSSWTGKIGFSCIDYNDNTAYIQNVTCDYSSETDGLDYVELVVERNDPVQPTRVCSTKTTSTSGSISCTGINASNSTYTYEFIAEFNDGTIIILQTETFGKLTNNYGDTGVLASFALFITFAMGGLLFPTATIALSVLALVVASFTGLFLVQLSSLASIITVAAILIWRMNR